MFESGPDHPYHEPMANTKNPKPSPRRRRGRPTNASVDAEFSDVAELGDGPAGDDGLTTRQRKMLIVIRDAIAERGYPPSMREVGAQVGLASPSSVAHQMRALEAKGFLRRDPNRPRAIDVRLPGEQTDESSLTRLDPEQSYDDQPESVAVPMLGHIAAGGPILAEEQVSDVMALPRQLVGSGSLFLLEVKGESMIDAAICDGDWVVVRQQPTANNGDIVAALLDDEATVKTFKRTSDQVWLLPHNEAYSPIDGTHAVIMGKVVAVMRRV